MATIQEILKIEGENTEHIHLFREGMFLKAYQRSAFLFQNQVKKFKSVKKYYKGANSDVAILGFPSNQFAELFPTENAMRASEA